MAAAGKFATFPAMPPVGARVLASLLMRWRTCPSIEVLAGDLDDMQGGRMSVEGVHSAIRHARYGLRSVPDWPVGIKVKRGLGWQLVIPPEWVPDEMTAWRRA